LIGMPRSIVSYAAERVQYTFGTPEKKCTYCSHEKQAAPL